MDLIQNTLQAIVGLAIINVWILRKDKPSQWRARNARTLQEEFATYGLSSSTLYAVGFCKLALAMAFILGIWIPQLTRFAAGGLTLFLLAALVAHWSVHDPFRKSVPAATLASLTASILLLP